MNRKLLMLMVLVLFLAGASTASALQYGYGSSSIDLTTFTYTVETGTKVYTRSIGTYATTGYALALDEDEVDADTFASVYYKSIVEGWADAYTSDAFASAATLTGSSSSEATAYAGDEYGQYSAALAGTTVYAYEFFLVGDGTVTITIDYYLSSAIYGDEDGFALAGAGAILGVYSCGDSAEDGEWIDLAGEYDSDASDASTGTLTITLSGSGLYKIFVGTYAYALAYAENSQSAPVPEPATLLLLGSGLMGIAGLSRKKIIKKS